MANNSGVLETDLTSQHVIDHTSVRLPWDHSFCQTAAALSGPVLQGFFKARYINKKQQDLICKYMQEDLEQSAYFLSFCQVESITVCPAGGDIHTFKMQPDCEEVCDYASSFQLICVCCRL